MSRSITGVHLDPQRGHISLVSDIGVTLVTMADTGQQLEVWMNGGCDISPAKAREIADVLERWADRHDGRGWVL